MDISDAGTYLLRKDDKGCIYSCVVSAQTACGENVVFEKGFSSLLLKAVTHCCRVAVCLFVRRARKTCLY